MTTWAEAVPGWVVPSPPQVADADRMARALAEANASAEAAGVVLAVGWVVGAWPAPLTARPNVVGGVLGALAGGIPAWLLAKRQSDETLRRDREQRVENQKALAFSVVVKLLHVINSTISLSNHVKSCLALRNDPDRAHMEPWQVLVPMIGHTDEGSIRFTADEMGVFAAANEYDFMQDMMLLAVRHSSSLATFQEYCAMRNEFRAIGPKPQDFDGQIGGGWLTPEEVDSYKPYTIPMNNVVVGLNAGLEEDVRLARTVAERFGPVTAKHFKIAKFADLTFPSDDELAAMRQAPNTAP